MRSSFSLLVDLIAAWATSRPFACAGLTHAPVHARTLQRPPHDTSSSDGEYICALLRKQLDLKSPATGFCPSGFRLNQPSENPARFGDTMA
jgi:hypothetical protein